jgi:hypothetical protein
MFSLWLGGVALAKREQRRRLPAPGVSREYLEAMQEVEDFLSPRPAPDRSVTALPGGWLTGDGAPEIGEVIRVPPEKDRVRNIRRLDLPLPPNWRRDDGMLGWHTPHGFVTDEAMKLWRTRGDRIVPQQVADILSNIEGFDGKLRH